MKRFELSLKKQIIALIALPLCFELLFVFVLVDALNRAEQDYLREARNKEVVNCVNRINKDLLSGGTLVGMKYLSRNEKYIDGVEYLIRDINAQRLRLRDLIQNDANLAEYKAFDSYLASNLLSFEELRSLMTDSSNKLGGILLLQRMNKLFELTSNASKAIVEEREQKSELARLSQIQSRERIRNIILGAVVLNIFFACVMTYLLITKTLRRLNVLMINNQKLSQNLPLEPRLEGHDEIGEIDATFHSMAESLAAAKEKERAFVAMLSHDLRSPITGVKLLLEMMEIGVYGEFNERGQAALSVSEKAIKRSLQMIDDFLVLERSESTDIPLTLEVHDLAETLNEVISLVSNLAEQKSVSIKSEFESLELLYDEAGIVRVATNLITNAIKFSPPQGTVTVLLEAGEMCVRIIVADEGDGIPLEKRALVFDRYQQLQTSDTPKHEGFGLGLPICKTIVSAHGGEIGIESEVEHGSRFWFTIPMRELPASSTLKVETPKELV